MVEDKGRLCHRQDDQVGARVDRPCRTCQATPAVLSRVRALVLLLVLTLDLPQAVVAQARLVKDKHLALPVAGGRDVVADDVLHRLAPQDTHTVKLSKVPQHEQKPHVVVERAHHAALHGQRHLHATAAREDRGGIVADPTAVLSALVNDHELVCQVGLAFNLFALVPRTDPAGLLRRHSESRVAHLQRPADALLDHHVKALPGHHLQDAAKNVQAVAVVPAMPRLALERHLGQGVAPLL
mmetsp:Transcript_98992/g.262992  ORF Transcript_98992/g.262992 Transcript_98992/m.262992 type:complete len:240 (+) Transcript_98992:1035-1754(+)